MIKEKNIQNQCVEQIRTILPVKNLNVRDTGVEGFHLKIDGFLDAMTEKGELIFVFEIKRIIKRPIPEQLFQYKKNINEHFILFAEYVNVSIAEDLKKRNVNFVDCQGNIFIHIPDYIYIDIQGNKLKTQKEKEVTAIFQPKGLQLLSVLLTNENALNFTIRKLSPISGISFGRTVAVMNELKNKGYILETAKNKYEFKEKKKLFDKWLELWRAVTTKALNWNLSYFFKNKFSKNSSNTEK